jgi:TolB-like protein/DNA-binding winged helix-turn-helix (wHTH) protein
MLRIGDWCVNPTSGQIWRDGETAQLEGRTLRLLLCLAEHVGEVVSIDDLLNQVWSSVAVSPDSVYQAVASLRRQLGDDPKQPTYIATVPRLGYRMVAAVSAWEEKTTRAPSPASNRRRPRLGYAVTWAGVAVCLALTVAFVIYGRGARRNHAATAPGNVQSDKSIAVLPFLDLTDKMSHEIFADGMTEEMIDKLSKIPGFRVTAPRTSFQLKGKKMSIADVGKTLGVAFVLDGSIRKSGSTMRVAARLVRADNGYVVWSESYERPWGDLLKVQNDIAAEVTTALRASIEGISDQRQAQ